MKLATFGELWKKYSWHKLLEEYQFPKFIKFNLNKNLTFLNWRNQVPGYHIKNFFKSITGKCVSG